MKGLIYIFNEQLGNALDSINDRLEVCTVDSVNGTFKIMFFDYNQDKDAIPSILDILGKYRLGTDYSLEECVKASCEMIGDIRRWFGVDKA